MMQAEVLNGTKGLKMTQRHALDVRSTPAPVVPSAQSDNLAVLSPLGTTPLRFAVSLTNPQGREVLRKQFASRADADTFAAATSELCPDYKVASVDRIKGYAWERVGSSVSITASPSGDKANNS
jgi:hypothetical protein